MAWLDSRRRPAGSRSDVGSMLLMGATVTAYELLTTPAEVALTNMFTVPIEFVSSENDAFKLTAGEPQPGTVMDEHDRISLILLPPLSTYLYWISPDVFAYELMSPATERDARVPVMVNGTN